MNSSTISGFILELLYGNIDYDNLSSFKLVIPYSISSQLIQDLMNIVYTIITVNTGLESLRGCDISLTHTITG